MESRRTRRHANEKAPNASVSELPAHFGHEPPRFVVDLSVAPEHRYDHIAHAFSESMDEGQLATEFEKLIDELVTGLPVGDSLRRCVKKCIKRIASFALRRVYTDEETAELRGIAEVTSLPMYLLVAFNVLLDLMMGCTSGGVRVQEQAGTESHMVHFRTLDWEMEPLRQLVLEVDFVSMAGLPPIATTVGYFGYVGVLTGVRKGLGMSLNFRPSHDRSTLNRRLSFRSHQIMTLLGLRPTISSMLRRFLLQPADEQIRHEEKPQGTGEAVNVGQLLTEVRCASSTAAYLIFTTPERVYSLEKDNGCAAMRTSETFLVTCNHDVAQEQRPEAMHAAATHVSTAAIDSGMGDIVDESFERKKQATAVWQRLLRRRSMASTPLGIRLDDVQAILRNEWVVNGYTQYAVIMDPKSGTVLWRRAYAAGVVEE